VLAEIAKSPWTLTLVTVMGIELVLKREIRFAELVVFNGCGPKVSEVGLTTAVVFTIS
jgi:hypothetical protein